MCDQLTIHLSISNLIRKPHYRLIMMKLLTAYYEGPLVTNSMQHKLCIRQLHVNGCKFCHIFLENDHVGPRYVISPWNVGDLMNAAPVVYSINWSSDLDTDICYFIFIYIQYIYFNIFHGCFWSRLCIAADGCLCEQLWAAI